MACEQQLAECLEDPAMLSCATCDEAKSLRCIIMARMRELTCSCMSSPVSIGNTRFPSPLEALRELRALLQMTFVICEQEAIEEGPVMETVWENGCRKQPCSPCSADSRFPTETDYYNRFHSHDGCCDT